MGVDGAVHASTLRPSLVDLRATSILDPSSSMLPKMAPRGCGNSCTVGCGLYAGGPRIDGEVGLAGRKVESGRALGWMGGET
jgi:hypothetical protein